MITENPDLVLFNLGYLPTCSKDITTHSETTLSSVKRLVNKITDLPNLLIIIVVYPGHNEGKIESELLDEYVKMLSSHDYLVCKYLNYNRLTSPYVLTISKNPLLK